MTKNSLSTKVSEITVLIASNIKFIGQHVVTLKFADNRLLFRSVSTSKKYTRFSFLHPIHHHFNLVKRNWFYHIIKCHNLHLGNR